MMTMTGAFFFSPVPPQATTTILTFFIVLLLQQQHPEKTAVYATPSSGSRTEPHLSSRTERVAFFKEAPTFGLADSGNTAVATQDERITKVDNEADETRPIPETRTVEPQPSERTAGRDVRQEGEIHTADSIALEDASSKDRVESASADDVNATSDRFFRWFTSSPALQDQSISASLNWPWGRLKVKPWCGKKFYSDLVREGLLELKKDASEVVMVYESPTSAATDTSFYSSELFNYHDYPASPAVAKLVLAPLRYSLMNGNAYPCFLADAPPRGLVEHWKECIPGFVEPTFTSEISATAKVNTYLPVELLNLDNHVNDPHVHYHLAGKDAIHLMTRKTTKVLANTKDHRPCVAKVTHAMGSKGIFVIRNDEDEAEFNQFLAETGYPKFVVTEFVDIDRNVACHFFIHPSGGITWFGSNENMRLPNGEFDSDSFLDMNEQDDLRDMQLPFVEDVVQYCRSLGFWGLCGIDVLFDHQGRGYLVDVNPRATGTCPALMTAQVLKEQLGFDYGLFRRNWMHPFRGSAEELLKQVKAFNEENKDDARIVVYSFHENNEKETTVNIGVFGRNKDQVERILEQFSPKSSSSSTMGETPLDEKLLES